MVQPIDYSAAFGGGASPLAEFTQAAQAGFGIRQMQVQQTQLEQQQLQQQQLRTDMAALSANPTPQAIAQMSIKYPQLSEQFKRSYDMLDSAQQQSRLNASVPIFAAIQNGRPELAAQQLRERAAALTNSGQEGEAKQITAMADMVEQHPETARLTIGTLLAGVMGPDKFAATFQTLSQENRAQEQAPGALRKVNADATAAESDAVTKGVQAKFAEPQALKDLELKGWNIKAIQEDIGYKKEANRIAAMNAAANKAGNDLKREELSLKVQEARAALDDKIRTKAADYEAGQATLQDALNLLTEIRSDPDTLAAATGSLAFRGAIPGTKARTVAGKIEQLQNTLAASNLDKLKGAMSDKDIAFLKNIASNLDRYQSESGFVGELGKVEEILIRSEKQMRNKFGGPKKPAPAVPSATEGAQGQRNVTVDW